MTRLETLAPGDYVRGFVHCCEQCEALFIGRSDARFCSNACRVAASRKR